MATHPIGPGTCNLSINVRTPVRAALGRLAFVVDVSMGEIVRRLLRLAVHFARAASRTRHIAAEIRSITADGVVTAAEVKQLNERCAREADAIATSFDRTMTRIA